MSVLTDNSVACLTSNVILSHWCLCLPPVLAGHNLSPSLLHLQGQLSVPLCSAISYGMTLVGFRLEMYYQWTSGDMLQCTKHVADILRADLSRSSTGLGQDFHPQGGLRGLASPVLLHISSLLPSLEFTGLSCVQREEWKHIKACQISHFQEPHCMADDCCRSRRAGREVEAHQSLSDFSYPGTTMQDS